MSKVAAAYSPARAKIFKLWLGSPAPAHFALIIWDVRKSIRLGKYAPITESRQATGATTRLQTGRIQALVAGMNLSLAPIGLAQGRR